MVLEILLQEINPGLIFTEYIFSKILICIKTPYEVYKFYEKVVHQYSFKDKKCIEILHIV